ncbi:MAG: hypothetical protein FWD94_07560, partial [Treponema sp.]|nr:hypothetical protein [Treponema sp.]
GRIAICRRFFQLDSVVRLQNEGKLYFFSAPNYLKRVNAVALHLPAADLSLSPDPCYNDSFRKKTRRGAI